ncbi:MAG: DUF1993 family protein [Gammaproteobacteria bacterium]|nr:DUF1993 family protein [Gammaproteobacteria bacterium]
MSISMFAASVPVFERGLTNLKAVLAKGEALAKARDFDPAVLITARLAPDMFALSRQVQIASDTAKGAAARLAGLEVPSWPDTESNFAELAVRIDRTLEFLHTFTPAQIDGSEQRPIELHTRRGVLRFTGLDYLRHFVLPNFYFHFTTTYLILRHNGVELGKMDFLGAV